MNQTINGNFLKLCSPLHTVDFNQVPRRAMQPPQSTYPAVGTKGSASHLSPTPAAQHYKRGQRGQRLSQRRNWGQS